MCRLPAPGSAVPCRLGGSELEPAGGAEVHAAAGHAASTGAAAGGRRQQK